MSSKESPKKGAGAGSTTDIDTLMPLLFAVHPEVKPNYKKMSAIDEYKRTAAALEHKFRKWRHKGVEIAAAHPEECSTKELVGTPAKTKMPRTKTAPTASEDKGSDAAEKEDCVPKSKKGKKRVASTPAEKKTTGKKAKKGNQKESTVSADEESDDIVPKKEDGDFAEDSVDMEFA